MHAPRRPAERKVRLHDTRAIVEQLDDVCIINSRVPLLPKFWGRKDGMPCPEGRGLFRRRYVQHESEDVIARASRVAVDDDVLDFGYRRCPCFPLPPRRRLVRIRVYALPVGRWGSQKLPKVGLRIVQSGVP